MKGLKTDKDQITFKAVTKEKNIKKNTKTIFKKNSRPSIRQFTKEDTTKMDTRRTTKETTRKTTGKTSKIILMTFITETIVTRGRPRSDSTRAGLGRAGRAVGEGRPRNGAEAGSGEDRVVKAGVVGADILPAPTGAAAPAVLAGLASLSTVAAFATGRVDAASSPTIETTAGKTRAQGASKFLLSRL